MELELPLQIFEIIREILIRVTEDKARNTVGEHPFGPGDTDSICQLVGPAVIASAHLQDVDMPGLQPRDTLSDHAGLRSGTEEPDLVDRREEVAHLLRKLVLIFMEKTGGRPAGIQKVYDLVPDFRRIGAEDSRAACLKQVKILVAVDIDHFISKRTLDCDRERIVKCKIVFDAARNNFLCLVRQFFGLLTLLSEVLFLIFPEIFRFDGINRLPDQRIQLSCDRCRIQIIVRINCITVVCHAFLPPGFSPSGGISIPSEFPFSGTSFREHSSVRRSISAEQAERWS